MKARELFNDKRVKVLATLALFVIYCVVMTVTVGSACPFDLIFGMPCPACGMTRANLLFLCGKPTEAYAMHPLFYFSYIVAIGIVVYLIKPKLIHTKPVSIVCVILALALLGVYVFRMVTMFPTIEPLDYNKNSLLGLILTACGAI